MSDSDSSDSDVEFTRANADEDFDDWEGEDEPVQCLFCPQELKSMSEFDSHTETKHNFNLAKTRSTLKLDFYGTVRLINYIRRQVVSGMKDSEIITSISSKVFVEDDQYLKPVLENDALLFGLDDEDEGPAPESESAPSTSQNGTIEMLQRQLQGLTELLTLDDPQKMSTEEVDRKSRVKETGYFDSYSSTHIHQEMLGDVVRTESYRDAMYKNKDVFKDKVVLDVGCGTGILCMFAARAGAKKVIGIDMSEMLDHARRIVAENGLEDKITLLKGKVEEQTLPVEKVDIIVSEWMGYFLQYEAMLETVLYARDRWLVPGGLVLPDLSNILVGGFELPEAQTLRSRQKFWTSDIYGFNMKCMEDQVVRDWEKDVEDPLVEVVKPEGIMSDIVEVARFDATTMKPDDLDFESDFKFTCKRDGFVDAIYSHFDIDFKKDLPNPVYFSTGAEATPTHWKQTCFILRRAISVKAGEVVTGHIRCKRNLKHHRHLDVEVSCTGPNGERQSQDYFLH